MCNQKTLSYSDNLDKKIIELFETHGVLTVREISLITGLPKNALWKKINSLAKYSQIKRTTIKKVHFFKMEDCQE